MNRMTPLAAFLAVLSLAACGASDPPGGGGGSHGMMPLSHGNSWTLSSDSSHIPGDITLSVIGDTVWKGESYAVLEWASPLAEPYYYFARIDNQEVLYLIEGGVREFALDFKQGNGQTYRHGEYDIRVTRPECPTVPWGELEDCVEFFLDAPQMADEETGFTFAHGVGIVRVHGSWGRDFRLTSFTPDSIGFPLREK